jgi:hypothetical protein
MKCPQNLYSNHSIHYEIFCEMTWGDTLQCKVPNNISLAEQFYVYVIIHRWHFHDNGSPYWKTFLFVSSIFPWRLPFHPCPNFSQFLFYPFPHISSVLSPPSPPRCSFNTFIFKFMVTDYIELLSIKHNYTEQKANFQTPCPSVHLHHSVCTIFMIFTIIPFTASSSSILRSKVCPCSSINRTCTTISLFCPDSISCHVWTKWNSHKVKTLTACTKLPEELTPGIPWH